MQLSESKCMFWVNEFNMSDLNKQGSYMLCEQAADPSQTSGILNLHNEGP